MIRSIVEESGAKIDVEDDGTVFVASADGEAMKKAIDRINSITAEAEIGKIYKGRVRKVMDFGAFVEILPGTDGLLHVSEMANHRVQDVRSEVKEGDQILVKVVNIDPSGKIRLSRKALLEGGEAASGQGGQGGGGGQGQGEPQPAGAYSDRRSHDQHRSHGDRGHRPDRDRGRGGDRGGRDHGDRRPR